MSRAKDPKIVRESQGVFRIIRNIAKIIAVVLVMSVAYSVITKKDLDVARLRKIQQEQTKRVMKRELAPYQKRVAELEEESEKRILAKEEMEELGWLLARTQGVKKKYAAPAGTVSKADEYEYKLSAGQKVYTQVGLSPGAEIRFYASHPFLLVSENSEREIQEYWMPAGENEGEGGGHSGPLVLKGIEDNTVVKIRRVD